MMELVDVEALKISLVEEYSFYEMGLLRDLFDTLDRQPKFKSVEMRGVLNIDACFIEKVGAEKAEEIARKEILSNMRKFIEPCMKLTCWFDPETNAWVYRGELCVLPYEEKVDDDAARKV